MAFRGAGEGSAAGAAGAAYRSDRFTSTGDSLGAPPGYTSRYAPSISESEVILAPPSSQHQNQRNHRQYPSSSAPPNQEVYDFSTGRQAKLEQGARSAAVRAPETPSMYTDPFEYATGVNEPRGADENSTNALYHGHANVLGTRPLGYLEQDPFAPQRGGASGLHRADTRTTLGPGDSVSVKNLPSTGTGAAPPRALGDLEEERSSGGRATRGGVAFDYAEDEADERQVRHSQYRSYEQQHGVGDGSFGPAAGYDAAGYAYGHAPDRAVVGGALGHHPSASASGGLGYGGYPATAPVGDGGVGDSYDYADDDAWDLKGRASYEARNAGAMDHDGAAGHAPPALFSNAMASQGNHPHDVKGYSNGGLDTDADDGQADRRGLLGWAGMNKSANEGRRAAKAGWGGTVEDQIERRRFGFGRQRWPVLSWLLAIVLVIVFIIELVKSASVTGQAVQTRPTWNPMLGPPFEFLINFGARFSPCMRNTTSIPTTTMLPCLNQTTTSANTYTEDQLCPIWEICGLSGPNQTGQSWRFVTPIFLHAGFVHIIFNLIVQLTLCCQIERLLSTPFYALVWIAGGIGGNLLGGNFGLEGQPALGASGAIYTCISLELVDLVYNWRYESRAKARLLVSLVFAVVGLAIGLLPGMDNWSHLGGFCVGLLGGLLFCPSIHASRRHRAMVWALRLAALGLLIGFFVGLATNFYATRDPAEACPWCRYLSCLPVFSQCKGNGLNISTTTTTTTGGGGAR